MLRHMLGIKIIANKFRKELMAELDNILDGSNQKTKSIIRNKMTERPYQPLTGAYVPIFLSILGENIDYKKSHFVVSTFNLGVALFDDASEGFPNEEKESHFYWLREVMLGNDTPQKIGSGYFEEVKEASKWLFDYSNKTYGSIDDDEYRKSINQLVDAWFCDDMKTIDSLEIRANLGKVYGEVNFNHLNKMIDRDLTEYKSIYLQLYAGGTILDDLADVIDDVNVKITKPVKKLNGKKPNIRNIISSGLIQEIFEDSDVEFHKAYGSCPNANVKNRYQATVYAVRIFYLINLFKSYCRNRAFVPGPLKQNPYK